VELAKHFLKTKPDIRVLFISGHVGASVIRFYGIDANDGHFLRKLFDSALLSRRVNEVLASWEPLRLREVTASVGGRPRESAF
jgi:predicted component of type VI protein secretion system